LGNKIKTVSSGGGSATPVANDFNNFLRQGLNNGSYGAVGQTQGIGSTLNSLLAGKQSSPELGSINEIMSRFSQQPNFQPSQISGYNPGSASFGGVDFSQGLGQATPQFSLPGMKLPNSVSGVNYSLPGGGADLSNIVSQIGMRNLLPSMNGQTTQAPTDVNTSGQQNTPEFDAISKILGNQFTKDLGDIRERYGVSSAGLNAESLYRSQAIPQLSQALSQSALGQRQAGQTDVGLGLQGHGLNLQGALGNLNAGVTQRGQDLESLLTGRNQDIQTGSLASGQSLAAIQNLLAQRGQDVSQTGLGVEQRGQDINALLTGRGQDASTGLANISNMLAGRGLDINQLGTISQMLMGRGGLDFNTQNANANNFLSGQGLLNQYMGTYGNLGLGQGQLNLAGQQLGQQGQMGALGQLMQALMQSNSLGTAQAQTQTYQTPSAFSNFLSGVNGITGALKGIMNLGNPFSSGGGGGSSALMGGNTPMTPGAGINMAGLQQMMSSMMGLNKVPSGGTPFSGIQNFGPTMLPQDPMGGGYNPNDPSMMSRFNGGMLY
jgi:hypothetical protein